MPSFSPPEEKFLDAQQLWDLERLYADLSTIKQKPLSSTEQICLRGLLCGLDPNEIAASLHRQPQGLRVDLTRGLYRYVAAIANKPIKNWRDVSAILEREGYKQNNEVIFNHEIVLNTVSSSSTLTLAQDWGDAPDVPIFFGRTEELEQLEQWTVQDRCRIVTILGMRGVGKTRLSMRLGMGGIGKTDLSLKLARGIQDQFEFVIWRSLLNAPPLPKLLTDLVIFLSQQQDVAVSDDLNVGISKLLHYLRTHRCLLILDNVETILQAGEISGQYRAGYEGYGQLFQQIGSVPHQSCLLLTSREKPKEIARLEGKTRPVRSLELKGLKIEEGQRLFAEIGNFSASTAEWRELLEFYNGNPLALELVAKHIHEVFDDNIAVFLRDGTPLFHDLRELLDWHFERLSEAEQELMNWIAIDREPVAIADLKKDILSPIAQKQVSATLQSLQRRFPLERQGDRFTQQPVVMEYITEQLIERTCKELVESHSLTPVLQHYALMKATAKEYIRESQIRVLVEPILAKLQAKLGNKAAIVEQLQKTLRSLRNESFAPSSYGGGNVINLLHQLGVDLSHYDFSHLAIRQAYLADANLHGVNFANADVSESVFAEIFGGISCVAFNSNGRYLATSDTSGNVQIWNLVTGKQQISFDADTAWTWAVAFSPDGQTLASAGDDYSVKLWDITTGTCVRILEGHTDTISAIAFRANGQLLASCSQDTTIRLWDLTKKDTFKACNGIFQGHQGRVWSLSFSPDNQTLISGSEDCTVKLWDVATGICYKTLAGHNHWVKSVALSANGKIIASGSFDGIIKLWDFSTGECLQTLQAHQSTVTTVAFRPVSAGVEKCEVELASCSYDQSIKLWDISTGKCLKTWQAHSSRIWSLAFSPNGEQLMSGGDDHAIRLWDVRTGQCDKTWKGHTNCIFSLASSPNQDCWATGHEDQTLKLWHSTTGAMLKTLSGHTNRVLSVAFVPSLLTSGATMNEGVTLVSGSADRTIKLWNEKTGQCLSTLQGHNSWVWSVAVHPNGRWLASGSYDQTIRLWDLYTGECLSILTDHTAPVVCVRFSPDGQWLASSSFDATIKLWQIPTGGCVQTFQGHQNSVWAIAFSPDSQRLASCSYDKTLKLWDIQGGECLQTLEGHTGSVVCLTFSPDGQMLASGSFDCTVKLWNINTGKLIHTFSGHADLVSSILFQIKPLSSEEDPDQQGKNGLESSNRQAVILSSSFDTTIRSWSANTATELQILRVPRPYEDMNITNTTGLTEAQKTTLYALGALKA